MSKDDIYAYFLFIYDEERDEYIQFRKSYDEYLALKAAGVKFYNQDRCEGEYDAIYEYYEA